MRYLLTILLCLLLYAASIGPVWSAWHRGWIENETWTRLAWTVYRPLFHSGTTYQRTDSSGVIWIDGPLADYLEWWR